MSHDFIPIQGVEKRKMQQLNVDAGQADLQEAL